MDDEVDGSSEEEYSDEDEEEYSDVEDDDSDVEENCEIEDDSLGVDNSVYWDDSCDELEDIELEYILLDDELDDENCVLLDVSDEYSEVDEWVDELASDWLDIVELNELLSSLERVLENFDDVVE